MNKAKNIIIVVLLMILGISVYSNFQNNNLLSQAHFKAANTDIKAENKTNKAYLQYMRVKKQVFQIIKCIASQNVRLIVQQMGVKMLNQIYLFYSEEMGMEILQSLGVTIIHAIHIPQRHMPLEKQWSSGQMKIMVCSLNYLLSIKVI